MKRWIVPLCCLLALACTGCGMQTGRGMYLQPAVLSKQEQALLKLVTGEWTGIYEFEADSSLESVQIRVYQLADGTWEMLSSSSHPLEKTSGRIAIQFSDLGAKYRTAVQEADQFLGSAIHALDDPPDRSGMSWATVGLDARQALRWGEEIPLAIQAYTEGVSLNSFDAASFFEPGERLSGYELVYALTAEFSRGAAGEPPVGEEKE